MFFALLRLLGVGLIVVLMFERPAYGVECGPVASYREVINCVATRAPEILRSDLDVQIAEANIDKARQIPNPELESRNLWGGNSEANRFATETQLLFPFQLGGKRQSRSLVAQAEKDSAEALAQNTKERTLIESAKALHRLRQLDVELFLATEAIERFERITTVFRKRPQLSPEQSVSLTVFKYALEEEKQKKSQALAEQNSILTDISLATGQKVLPKKELFPTLPENWPAIDSKTTGESATLKFARAKEMEGKALSDLARAEAWPDLKIGPTYERMPDRERTEERVGVGLAMDIPVFNRNQGGKRSAELSQRQGVLDSRQALLAANSKLESLIEQYSIITKALASAPTQAELEKGHKAFESHFNRGLVSYSLIIEAHRQLHDSVETKHRQELSALNLLWSIYQLTGRLSPEVL